MLHSGLGVTEDLAWESGNPNLMVLGWGKESSWAKTELADAVKVKKTHVLSNKSILNPRRKYGDE